MMSGDIRTIRCRWTEEGCFLVWCDGEPTDPLTFKHYLFGWHQPSFYGTVLNVRDMDGTGAVELPAFMALSYFLHAVPVQHARFVWGEEAALLRRAAPIFRRALEKGWFVPDFAAWTNGQPAWKLHLPPSEEPPYRSVLSWSKRLNMTTCLREWFDRIVKEITAQNEPVREAWDRLVSAYPLLQVSGDRSSGNAPTAAYMDEEEWLTAIGLQRDAVPFRTMLRLAEPAGDEEEVWGLQIILQDKKDGDLLVPCRLVGGSAQPVESRIPEEWKPHLESEVAKKTGKWLKIVPWLEDPSLPGHLITRLTTEQAWNFLTDASSLLVRSGTTILLPSWWENFKPFRPRLKAKIRPSAGTAGDPVFGMDQLIAFDWIIALGDRHLSETEFRRLAARKQRLVQIRGKWIPLDPSMLAQIEKTMERLKRTGLSLREVLELYMTGVGVEEEPPADVAGRDGGNSPSSLLAPRLEVDLNGPLAELIGKLRDAETVTLLQTPEHFRGALRKYQTIGFSWLVFLRRYGFGGCLADDMGLGKTVQWIAYLLHVKENEKPETPALLICPTSVLGNWRKEIERFAPSLRVYVHYGGKRRKGESFRAAGKEADLVITTYQIAQLDETELASFVWNVLCLDEAQNIKNPYTKQSQTVRKLKARHRIALSGTPIENRLTELWSIMDFVNPGYLGSLASFRRKYETPVERGNNDMLAGQLKTLIRPFLLRRSKKDPAVFPDLPEKNETKTYVSLTVEQAGLYEGVLRDLFDRLDSLSGMERRGMILSALTKLKQLCDHPALLLKENAEAGGDTRSGKVVRLLEMIRELREEGERCLIFTQFVEMGHMLKRFIEMRLGEQALFLHGGVPQALREEMIANFQETSQKDDRTNGIFILSLRAGGTGLNLTAANHVFHFDRWWNPAVENQATDRAFRIGQTRDVQVHKFVTLGTLEEQIDELIERKQDLNEQIVGSGENWITELSAGELKELLSLRKQWVDGQE